MCIVPSLPESVHLRTQASGESARGGGGEGGGVLDQYLGMGEPLRVLNPDPV